MSDMDQNWVFHIKVWTLASNISFARQPLHLPTYPKKLSPWLFPPLQCIDARPLHVHCSDGFSGQDQMNENKILWLMGTVLVRWLVPKALQIPASDCRSFSQVTPSDWWKNMEKGRTRLMEWLFDRIQGVNLAAPRPPGDNAHRAVTKEASPRRREGGSGGWGVVLVAKFESRRDIWTVGSPTVTAFEGNDQEFSFLQGWNLGDSEEIVLIVFGQIGPRFSFNSIPNLHWAVKANFHACESVAFWFAT